MNFGTAVAEAGFMSLVRRRFVILQLWAALTLAVALGLPQSAKAFCSVPQPRLVCAEYFASQLVVEATLMRTAESRNPQGEKAGTDLPAPAHVYVLRVNRIFRGEVVQGIQVYENNDSGRATFDWVPGKHYLVFLFHSSERREMWELDGCGNSGPLDKANTAIAEIATIKAARIGGVIHGIVKERALSQPMAGVNIEAQGSTDRYSATTNENGEFQLNVPAGRYVVRANKDGASFDTADISYENPGDVRIEPGGCAQVQFEGLERHPTR